MEGRQLVQWDKDSCADAGFLKIDLLRNTLTDTHFAKRDRMGRTLTFLARIAQDGWSANPREIAVDEKSALLVERDGQSRVIGSGKGAYFLSVDDRPEVCRENTPLTFLVLAASYPVYRALKWAARRSAERSAVT